MSLNNNIKQLQISFDTHGLQLVDGEHNPFAIVYITDDVKTSPRSIHTPCFRHTNGDTSDQKFKLSTFTALFDVDCGAGAICKDTSACVQFYSTLTNHNNELCHHKCGFVAVSLWLVARSNHHEHIVQLSDVGLVSMGNRGTMTVTFGGTAVDEIRRQVNYISASMPFDIVGAWHDAGGNLVTVRDAVASYRKARVQHTIKHMNPTDPDITLYLFPDYVQSSGTVAPTFAFLLAKEPPMATEEYYLVALDSTLARHKVHGKLGCSFDDILASGTTTIDILASILMQMAMCLPVAHPYLFDASIHKGGTSLCTADEFSRTMRTAHCSDCEDCSCEASMVLWHILVGTWNSKALCVMQRVRACYVSVLTLKSVTRPAQSGTAHKARRLAAHACCDLVPLRFLNKMLRCVKVDTNKVPLEAVNAIERERSATITAITQRYGVPSVVIVGEGTGIVQSCVNSTTDTVPKWARTATHDAFSSVWKHAKLVSFDGVTSPYTSFYRYVVSGVVHDVQFSAVTAEVARRRGEVYIMPEIVYVTTTSHTYTKGAAHHAYVSFKEDDDNGATIGIICSPPVPKCIWNITAGSAKFEEPIPPLTSPTADVTILIKSRAESILTLELTHIRASDFVIQNATAVSVICVSLGALDAHSLAQLNSIVKTHRDILGIRWHVSVLTHDTGVVTFHVYHAHS